MQFLLRCVAWAWLFALPALGQWNSDAGQNLPIAQKPAEQVVPKVAVAADGSVYLGWFDQASGNYDVLVQRLDVHGLPLWGTGVVVSSQPQSSSLVDWDLTAVSGGGAVVVFTDTRAGSDLDVYAYRLSSSGQQLWGANGVTLSSNNDYEPSPKVCETSDGKFVFVWGRYPNIGDGRLQLQKLDLSGNLLLGPNGVALAGGPGEDPGFAQLVADQSGGFVLAWIRDIATFFSPRHLYAQKYNAAGQAQWGATPLKVYEAASLPIAYWPVLQSDKAGGAVFAWHVAVGSFFQSRVQKVNALGVEAFAHNGLELSLEANRSDFYPALALQSTGELFAFYLEENAGQSQWGLSAQLVSSGGALLWGNNGKELTPYDGVYEGPPSAVLSAAGAQVYYAHDASGLGFEWQIRGMSVDAAGNLGFGPITASSVQSSKDDLCAKASGSGGAVLAWTDQRNGDADLYAQNVRMDGTLGLLAGSLTAYGCGLNPEQSFVHTGGLPELNEVLVFEIDDVSNTTPIGAQGFLLISAAPWPAYPCGLPLPGWGLGDGLGEFLLDPFVLLPLGPYSTGSLWFPGQPAQVAVGIPNDPSLIEAQAYLQGALVSPLNGALLLANALELRIGY